MNFVFTHQVDKANKLLICEAQGELANSLEMEYTIKNIIKIAGKTQMTNVVFDVTALRINCTSIEISNLLMDVRDLGLLGDIKIARITTGAQNSQNMIEEIAKNLSLSIRNFETRSEALLWLLFNKMPRARY
jgi:hypothetical protein